MCGMVWCGIRKDRILKVIKTIFIELTNVNIQLPFSTTFITTSTCAKGREFHNMY